MVDLLTPAQLRARGGLKWTRYDEDVLAAWIAEMDFGLAPRVAHALHDAVDRADTAYPYPELEEQIAEAACGFWTKRLGWEVEPGRVFAAPDVTEGLRRAVMHLTRPDSPVILHTPIYHPFYSMVARAGRRLIDVPCSPDPNGVYHLDLDGIDRAFAAGAGSIVLCNPWNPVGRSLAVEEVDAVIELASARKARVICDEIHAALTYEGSEHVVACTRDPEVVVTVTAASKAFNTPGLKCAQVVLSNDEDLRIWREYFTPEKVGAGTFGLIANAAGYRDGGPWLDEVLAYLGANRRLLGELLAHHLPGVLCALPEATYLAWLDFRGYGLSRPATYLLERARIALDEGARFGRTGSGFARLNFATPAPILEEIIERTATALA